MSAKKVKYSARFVCLSVWQQDYGKITGSIFMKLGERVKHGPGKNPLKFEAYSNHRANTQIICHFGIYNIYSLGWVCTQLSSLMSQAWRRLGRNGGI